MEKFIEFLKISDEIHNELMKKHEERVPLILKSVVDIVKNELSQQGFTVENVCQDLQQLLQESSMLTPVIDSGTSFGILDRLRSYVTKKYTDYLIFSLRIGIRNDELLEHKTKLVIKTKETVFYNELYNALKSIDESYSVSLHEYHERQCKFEEETKAFLQSEGIVV